MYIYLHPVDMYVHEVLAVLARDSRVQKSESPACIPSVSGEI